jgi:hypothetical protein
LNLPRALLAAALVAGLALVVVSPARAASDSAIRNLYEMPCPPRYEAWVTGETSPEQRQRALDGYFEVEDRYTRLIPPVDWRMDPYSSRGWTASLQKFTWINPLIAVYRGNDFPASTPTHRA